MGYRLLPWLAAEGQFDWLPGFDAKQANDLTVIDGTTWMVSANAKAWPRPEDRFQPFALIGLGYLRSWNQPIIGPAYGGGGFAARFGGGLDAHITRHWLLSIEVALRAADRRRAAVRLRGRRPGPAVPLLTQRGAAARDARQKRTRIVPPYWRGGALTPAKPLMIGTSKPTTR